MNERPLGARPPADRSDWTEQDLLTRHEALPRLESAIEEADAEYQAAQDATARELIGRRLDAMRMVRQTLVSDDPGEPGG